MPRRQGAALLLRAAHAYTASARHLHGICTASTRRLHGGRWPAHLLLELLEHVSITYGYRRDHIRLQAAPAPRAPRARRARPAPLRSCPRSSRRAASPAAGGGRPVTPLTSQLPTSHLTAPNLSPHSSQPLTSQLPRSGCGVGRGRCSRSTVPSCLFTRAAALCTQAATLGVQPATCASSLPATRLPPHAPRLQPYASKLQP